MSYYSPQDVFSPILRLPVYFLTNLESLLSAFRYDYQLEISKVNSFEQISSFKDLCLVCQDQISNQSKYKGSSKRNKPFHSAWSRK